MRRDCSLKTELLLLCVLYIKQSDEFTRPKQSVLNLKTVRFLVRHRLLIHNNPANEWADYWGEDEEAVISTWLEWNRRWGGTWGDGGWLWRYKSSLRNRAANTICHALSPRLLAWLQVKGRMMLSETLSKDVGADCRRCGFTGCARQGEGSGGYTRRCMSNRQREALSHTEKEKGCWASGYSWWNRTPSPTHHVLGLLPTGSCQRIPSGSYEDALHKHSSHLQLLRGE